MIGKKTSYVLAVDDSPLQVAVLRSMLLAMHIELRTANNVAQCIPHIEAGVPLLVLVELMLDQDNGFQVCRKLLGKYPVACVLMTATGRDTDAAWAEKLGIKAVVSRPISRRSLESILEDALDARDDSAKRNNKGCRSEH